MTDCILKVFNNLMCASLRKRSTKDKKHRGKSRLEYQITVSCWKGGGVEGETEKTALYRCVFPWVHHVVFEHL